MKRNELIRDLKTYLMLYIKHVRFHEYKCSFYSFLSMYGESSYRKICGHYVDIALRTQGYIIRTSRMKYRWNAEGKFFLVKDIDEFIRQALTK